MPGLDLRPRLRSLKRWLPRWTAARLRLPPAWVGYRAWRTETVRQYLDRIGGAGDRYQVVHPEAVHHNPLPRGVSSAGELPDTVGWWGFSFRDVPARRSAETFIATLPDCRVVQYVEGPEHRFAGDYQVAILGRGDRSIELREVRFRERHGLVLRSQPKVRRLRRVTWIAERVYHNHSHWLTAHVPKLDLLRSQGLLEDLVLPSRTTPAIEASLRRMGLDRRDFPTVDLDTVLDAEELTIVGSDRFRPELLQTVRSALAIPRVSSPSRRIYISRARAARRRLLNEEEIWSSLRRAGFERVFMEDLPFDEQVDLMAETAVLVAPHGAGLTNMLFCPPGTHVVEIADLGFPNPNFYAVASAMGHPYWLIPARSVGDGHPLGRDMFTDHDAFESILASLLDT